MTYLVTYEQIVSPNFSSSKIINTHKAFVNANDANEAINSVKDILLIDEKTSKGIITYDNFTAKFCEVGDMLLDNGTCVINGTIMYV